MHNLIAVVLNSRGPAGKIQIAPLFQTADTDYLKSKQNESPMPILAHSSSLPKKISR